VSLKHYSAVKYILLQHCLYLRVLESTRFTIRVILRLTLNWRALTIVEHSDFLFMLEIAVPAGTRMGNRLELTAGKVLYKRLKEHAESIKMVENLNIDDFYCRFLVVDDIWIPLGESLMIARFMPLWNSLIDGFGNHNPGKGRHAGMRPRWDVLHPGRKWAIRLAARPESQQQIAQEAETYLKVLPIS